jgi:hypothetical protein
MFGKLQWNIGTIWCGVMHESLKWPAHGHYECRTCGRRYPAFGEPPLPGRPKKTASSGVSQSSERAPAATALSRA